jgi:hypothetical protein
MASIGMAATCRSLRPMRPIVILRPGAEAKWDYRRPAMEPFCRAVHAMLMDRAVCGETAAAVGAQTP